MHHHEYEHKKAHTAKAGSTGHEWKKRCLSGGGAPVPPAASNPPPATPSPFKMGGRPKMQRRAAGGAAKVRRGFPFTHPND